MLAENKSITEIIDNDYKEYCNHVIYHRAIPSMIDGFKPVQRKIFYVMRSIHDFTKIESVSGKVIDKANYEHGGTSVSEALTKMTQDFCGSNNIPYFIGKGSFGSQIIPNGYASPRYIFSKYNKFMDYIYLDNAILEQSDNIENPEPKHYYPIIPMVLVNGAKGIAVGFATNISNYNPKDIIKYIQDDLTGVRYKEPLKPYYNDFKGDIDKYTCYGECEIINTTTIRVTELPIGITREQYIEYLYKLVNKKEIEDFTDNSDDKWDITIKVKRATLADTDFNIYDKLKLSANVNENITVIDENGEIKVYNCVEDLIRDFVDFRIQIYYKRIEYMLKVIQEKIDRLDTHMLGIENIPSDFINMTDKQIRSHYKSCGMNEDQIDFVMGLSISRLNKTYIAKIKKDKTELRKEYKYYKEVDATDLYLADLNILLEKLNGIQ
ncbi:DNA gyrase subunit A [uncultured Arcobacter sp.]|uniref:DNA gyrase subunit A n=1 Tax=uncultured Arcobacter sp. TaxID=165434 RepID=UPI002630B80C|nr:DNA gyrase subunit A [uncultured Arcobacter sp.]